MKSCLEDLSRASSEELEATTIGREYKQELEKDGVTHREEQGGYQYTVHKGAMVL